MSLWLKQPRAKSTTGRCVSRTWEVSSSRARAPNCCRFHIQQCYSLSWLSQGSQALLCSCLVSSPHLVLHLTPEALRLSLTHPGPPQPETSPGSRWSTAQPSGHHLILPLLPSHSGWTWVGHETQMLPHAQEWSWI